MTPIKEKVAWTPGPWKLGMPKFPWKGNVYGPDGIIIAAISENYINAEANARLIAKAPEMAEALLSLTTLIRNMRDIYANNGAYWLLEQSSFQNAERILKEAGRSGL